MDNIVIIGTALVVACFSDWSKYGVNNCITFGAVNIETYQRHIA